MSKTWRIDVSFDYTTPNETLDRREIEDDVLEQIQDGVIFGESIKVWASD